MDAILVLDYAADVRWGAEASAGLLVAIVTDGIPENLSLGVALIGRSPGGVAAFTGSILLSNLPEAAGSAREMVMDETRSRRRALALWICTAGVLVLAGLAGYELLRDGPGSVTACWWAGCRARRRPTLAEGPTEISSVNGELHEHLHPLAAEPPELVTMRRGSCSRVESSTSP